MRLQNDLQETPHFCRPWGPTCVTVKPVLKIEILLRYLVGCHQTAGIFRIIAMEFKKRYHLFVSINLNPYPPGNRPRVSWAHLLEFLKETRHCRPMDQNSNEDSIRGWFITTRRLYNDRHCLEHSHGTRPRWVTIMKQEPWKVTILPALKKGRVDFGLTMTGSDNWLGVPSKWYYHTFCISPLS